MKQFTTSSVSYPFISLSVYQITICTYLGRYVCTFEALELWSFGALEGPKWGRGFSSFHLQVRVRDVPPYLHTYVLRTCPGIFNLKGTKASLISETLIIAYILSALKAICILLVLTLVPW